MRWTQGSRFADGKPADFRSQTEQRAWYRALPCAAVLAHGEGPNAALEVEHTLASSLMVRGDFHRRGTCLLQRA